MKFNFFLTSLKNGGGELITLALVNYLAKHYKDLDVNLFCETTENFNVRQEIKIHQLDFRKKFSLFQKLLSWFRAEKQKDVVFLSVLTGMNIACGLTNLLNNRRLFLFEHSDLGRFYFSRTFYLRRIPRVLLYNLALLRVEKIFFVSEHALKNSEKFFLKINKKKFRIIENPIFDLREKIKFSKELKSANFLMIGRHSPEKRLVDGLRFLDRCQIDADVNVVSDKEPEVLTDLKVLYFSDYSNLINVCINQTVLLNFSLVESYSLVVAEWLKLGGTVLSADGASINKIWENYRGFYIFNEKYDFKSQVHEVLAKKKKDLRPKFIGINIKDYAKNFMQIFKKGGTQSYK